jgi:hypothetical protein
MSRFIAAIISLCLFISSGVKSQIKEDSCLISADRFLQHTSNYLTAPFHYSNEEFNDVIKVAALTGVSFFVDKDIKSFSQNGKHRSAFLDNLTKIDNYYGDKDAFVILGGTLLTGVITRNRSILNAGFMLTESVFFSNIITQSLKIVLGRERPEFTNNNLHFIGPVLGNDQFHSLPSGHATTSFAISTVAAGLTDNQYLKILFYTPAFLTSFSRVYHNRHWLSDVMFGSLIGYYTGQKVLSMNGKLQESETVKIDVGFNNLGVMVQF